jgi:hypothetical protein
LWWCNRFGWHLRAKKKQAQIQDESSVLRILWLKNTKNYLLLEQLLGYGNEIKKKRRKEKIFKKKSAVSTL